MTAPASCGTLHTPLWTTSYSERRIVPSSTIGPSCLYCTPPTRESMERTLINEGLPQEFSAADLRDLCAPHGKVLSTRVVPDADGLSLSYGFVKMATREDAEAVIQALDGRHQGGCYLYAARTHPYSARGSLSQGGRSMNKAQYFKQTSHRLIAREQAELPAYRSRETTCLHCGGDGRTETARYNRRCPSCQTLLEKSNVLNRDDREDYCVG